MRNKCAGFSLIEMIVAVGIMAVVAIGVSRVFSNINENNFFAKMEKAQNDSMNMLHDGFVSRTLDSPFRSSFFSRSSNPTYKVTEIAGEEAFTRISDQNSSEKTRISGSLGENFAQSPYFDRSSLYLEKVNEWTNEGQQQQTATKIITSRCVNIEETPLNDIYLFDLQQITNLGMFPVAALRTEVNEEKPELTTERLVVSCCPRSSSVVPGAACVPLTELETPWRVRTFIISGPEPTDIKIYPRSKDLHAISGIGFFAYLIDDDTAGNAGSLVRVTFLLDYFCQRFQDLERSFKKCTTNEAFKAKQNILYRTSEIELLEDETFINSGFMIFER